VRKRSLFAVLAILVVLFILTTFRFPFSDRIKTSISNGFIPFLNFFSKIQITTGFLMDRIKNYSDLQTENTELKKKVSELSTRAAQFSELERENRDFRAMLDFKDKSEFKLVTARVVSRDPSNWFNSVLIDRGTEDGMTENLPVLTVDGLVGKTTAVTKNNSHVLLLVDENCKVSAWMKESGQYGIVQGNILSGGRDSLCRMTFIDRLAQLKLGDQVLTSGLGGIFPKGIVIGTVRAIKPSADALYQEVNIAPAVDLARIDEVFVGIGVKPPVKAKVTQKKTEEGANP
jgi:rod shape-determining protein MreC